MASYSSPNRLIWQYCEALRRARARAHEADDRYRQQEVAVAVFLSVTVVEVFLNIFFRVVVEEEPYREHKAQLLKDLAPPFLSLDKKWKRWPTRVFGIAVDPGVDARFVAIKDLRNKLMHFTSSHDTIKLPNNLRLQGLPNTSRYEELTLEDADEAVKISEDGIAAIFRTKGVPVEDIPKNLQMWTGKVPV